MKKKKVKIEKICEWILSELQKNHQLTVNDLVERYSFSVTTGYRMLDRMRADFLMPIEFDQSRKTYYLTDPNFKLSPQSPVARDELATLLIVRDLLGIFDSTEIVDNLDSLWKKLSVNSPAYSSDLEDLVDYFGVDTSIVADLADQNILAYLAAAKKGENVQITYKSPWQHKEPKEYQGRILKVQLNDNKVYLLLAETSGRETILNCSFVKDFRIINYDLEYKKDTNANQRKATKWLQGYGIWAGDDMQQIEIHILAPAAEYYAAEKRHPEQKDTWSGTTLVRCMPGMASPQLIKQILSIGAYVSYISPQELKESVIKEALAIAALIQKS